jgi:hypothetical protein
MVGSIIPVKGAKMSVYEDVFDLVVQNLEVANKPWEYHKVTFLCEVKAHPGRIDVTRYLKLSNTDFLQAIYVAALRRLPESKEQAYWADQMDQPAEAFQDRVLRKLAHSVTAAIHRIQFVNNPYFDSKPSVKTRLLGLTSRLSDMTFLRKLGKKCPKPLQRFLRKVFQ